jgi:zeta-associated protein zap-70, putative
MCSKWSGWQLPPTYWGLSLNDIRNAVIKKSREWGLSESLMTFSIEYLSIANEEYSRNVLTEVTKLLINKTLHEIQPWFHGRLSRHDAERSIEESGHKEGKFL